MPLLSMREAYHASDSFLFSLYGSETFSKWKQLKSDMQFITEKEYVDWLLDVACQYRSNETASEQEQYPAQHDTCSIKQETEEFIYSQEATYFDEQQNSYSQATTIQSDPETRQRYRSEEDCKSAASFTVPDNSAAAVPGHVESGSGGLCYERDYSADDCYPTEAAGSAAAAAEHVDGEGIVSDEDDDAGTYDELTQSMEATGTSTFPSPSQSFHVHNYYLPDPTSSPSRTSSSPATSAAGKKFYPCPHCKFTTSHKSTISRHVDAIHRQVKSHACEHCQYTATRKSSIDRHLILKHGYESKYKCPECNRCFVTPSDFSFHRSRCKSF